MMTIKEYINKNLLNLNWNILPQIFEENEVELTEEIKTYLKNTPWNTNWNIIKFIDGEESSELTTKKTNLYLTSELSGKNLNLDTTKSDFATFEEAYDYYDSNSFSDIALYIDDVKFDIDMVVKDPNDQGHEEWGIKGTYGAIPSAIIIIHAFGATKNWQNQGTDGR